MKTEVRGFGRVDETGGVGGAHLEQHAQFEFAQRLSTEASVRVIEGVASADDVKPKLGALAENPVE